MTQITNYQRVGLVGIKGVGMTALAQCLLDLGMSLIGYDVTADFVTAEILNRRQCQILSLDAQLDPTCQCLIYSAAYDPTQQPLLVQAEAQHIPVLTLAEAVAQLFNQKSGIAVCGVGGKSSVSAWITWLLDQTDQKVSAVVGVGKINGLSYTGRWQTTGKYFVAEADEYAQNPMAVRRGEKLIARFMALRPQIVVCTNLRFDHPDVYSDFTHTQKVFTQFFQQIKPQGTLIFNQDDPTLVQLAQALRQTRPDVTQISFGTSVLAQVQLVRREFKNGQSVVSLQLNNSNPPTSVQYRLSSPGQFFALNSAAVLAVGLALQIPLATIRPHLASFASVGRRLEKHGRWRGVELVDDYAHTPHELSAVITTLREITQRNLVVCFQPHTFSRTRAYLDEFVASLALADQVVLLPIFPSAREVTDAKTSSDQILAKLQARGRPAWLCTSFTALVELLPQICQTGDTFATLGAGDVYQVMDLLTKDQYEVV